MIIVICDYDRIFHIIFPVPSSNFDYFSASISILSRSNHSEFSIRIFSFYFQRRNLTFDCICLFLTNS
nr:MAG TPA: hypothetical protein [Caudoviricetes sp.]